MPTSALMQRGLRTPEHSVEAIVSAIAKTRGTTVANAEIRLVTSRSSFCLAKNSVLEAGHQARSGAPRQVS